MKHISLFSGMGGFDLAAEWMGWENIAHCEWNLFCQRILKYYWPNAETHTDITKTDFTIYRNRVDIVTGGFPCQPFSVAGKQKGTEDERHLWPEMLRAIREIQPPFVVGENVPGLINWSNGMVFNQVQADLENEGYEVTPFILPAAGIDAPHGRSRIWFIAYSTKFRASRGFGDCNKQKENTSIRKDLFKQAKGYGSKWITAKTNSCIRWEICGYGAYKRDSQEKYNVNSNIGGRRDATNSTCIRLRRQSNRIRNSKQPHKISPSTNWSNFPTSPSLCDGDDGISTRLDGITFSKWRNESIKAVGNAIVPQVALQIFNAIELFIKEESK